MDMKVVPIPHILMNMVGDTSIAYCAEEWGEYKRGRLVYSVFSLVVQVTFKKCVLSKVFQENSLKCRFFLQKNFFSQQKVENC
jgi:hypothetical protein